MSKLHLTNRRAVRSRSAFHLPEVCRQIYSETAVALYQGNVFVADADFVQSFYTARGDPISRLLPAQKKAITVLQLTCDSLRLLLRHAVMFHPARQLQLRKRVPGIRILRIGRFVMERFQLDRGWDMEYCCTHVADLLRCFIDEDVEVVSGFIGRRLVAL